MRIGLQIPSFKYPGGTEVIRPKLKEIAQTAEGAGFYSMWVMDHFYQIKGLFGEKYTDPMMESYTTLAYLAGVTEKVTLGALVTGIVYRHPTILMKTVNTLDILSGGRAYFGVGAAWYEDESRGFGLPYPPTKERFEILEETLQLAHELWGSGVQASFHGKHINAPQVTNNPAPVHRPKIMVGGSGPTKTLRFVAQYADASNLFESYGKVVLQEKLDTLKQHCDDLGRPYEEIEKTTLGTVTIAPGKDTPESIIERCRVLADLGFTHAIFNMTNVYEITPLEVFGQEIIPVVADL
jgi:F420-dependent oxidoreductase-like protein